MCSLILQDTVFVSNQAGQEGGAIKWNFYEPSFINVSYQNNSADIYGDDIASVASHLIRIAED